VKYLLKFRVFWTVAPCSLGVDRRLRSAYCLHHQVSSETSAYSETTLHYILDDSKVHTLRRENQKSHEKYLLFMIWLSLLERMWIIVALSLDLKSYPYDNVHCMRSLRICLHSLYSLLYSLRLSLCLGPNGKCASCIFVIFYVQLTNTTCSERYSGVQCYIML
jgi:hypothetical protein